MIFISAKEGNGNEGVDHGQTYMAGRSCDGDELRALTRSYGGTRRVGCMSGVIPLLDYYAMSWIVFCGQQSSAVALSKFISSE